MTVTNTALRAGAQSADNTHMVFANEEHEKFYIDDYKRRDEQISRMQNNARN